jgi:hypothetical protein
VAALVAVTAALVWPAWLAMTTSFENFDDEGYWLIALRSFHEHGSLYHNTWTQAGPAYYEIWSCVYRFLALWGLGIDHDTGRVLTLIVWLLTSLLAGLATWRAFGRVCGAVVVEIVTFLVMTALRNEPMEPAGLATLFLVGAVFAATTVRRDRPGRAMFFLGALLTLALLCKVNIGVFGWAAAAVTALCCWPSRRELAWRSAGMALMAAVPWALMHSTLHHKATPPFLHLEWLATGGIALVTLAVAPRERVEGADRARARAAVRAAAGGAVVAGVGGVIGVLASGTSPAELVNGAFLAQRGLANIFSYPLWVPPEALRDAEIWTVAAALVALCALAGRHSRWPSKLHRVAAGPWPPAAVAVAQVLVGLWIPFSLIGSWTGSGFHATILRVSFVPTVPAAWLGLLGPGWNGAGYRPGPMRYLLSSVAVLLTLEAYPVDGSQLWWSCVGLALLSGSLTHDGLTTLGTSTRFALPSLRATATLLTFAPFLAAATLAGADLSHFTDKYHSLASASETPGLPHTALLRWPTDVVDDYRPLVDRLRKDCTTFFGFPGLDSLYFFTGETPPTDLQTTQWMYLMDLHTQARIQSELETIPRLCIVDAPQVLPFWTEGKRLPSTPLVRYVQSCFVPTWKTADSQYVIRARDDSRPQCRSRPAS